jgi:uncharacterized protein YjbI with pentapeptide repeats
MNRLKSKLRTAINWTKVHWIWLVSGSVTLLLAFAIFLYISPKWQWSDWTGFGEDSTISQEETLQNGKFTVTKRITQFQSGKTLWDWLGLAGVIAIPVALFWFQQQQQKKSDKQTEAEKEITAINLREEALRDYIDKMADLLIDKKMRRLVKFSNRNQLPKDSLEFDQLRASLDVTYARTLSILRRLDEDAERKGSVVRFLIDAGLIEGFKILKDANLRGANLSAVNLSFSNLTGVDFSESKLSYSVIKGATLFLAKFVETDLIGATLEESRLQCANFNNACLRNANFQGANLLSANLEGADLQGANFESAKNLDVNQVKAALNWELAYYDLDFSQQLGLLPRNAVQ